MLTALLLAVTIQATPPVNPTVIAFTCPDHAEDSQHEVDVVTEAGAVLSTILVGDPPVNAAGEVEVTLSIQPIKFGRYTFKVRAVGPGGEKSASSDASEVWVRGPGKPGKPIVK